MGLPLTRCSMVAVLAFWLASGTGVQAETAGPQNRSESTVRKMVDQGRYLSKIAGCNDCHTPGYMFSEGKIPETLWLTGDSFGWRGPWGTTYGSNLRIFVSGMTEEDWVAAAKTLVRRPPMPWFNLNGMKEEDLQAIFQFIRSLGPTGDPAPEYVPPDQEPKTPHALFPPPPK